MTTQVQIANLALTKLGSDRIIALSDNTKPAREMSAMYDAVLEAELRKHRWNFAMTRTALAADAAAPAYGYARQFTLPANCLRLIQVGEYFVPENLMDYRSANSAPYTLEGRKILTDLGAPLKVRYVRNDTDPSEYDACFVQALASKLAAELAEPLTSSNSTRDRAERSYDTAMLEASMSNAVELPPKHQQDDSWIMARLR